MVGFMVECDHKRIIKELRNKINSFLNLKTDFSNGSFKSWKLSHQSTHKRKDGSEIICIIFILISAKKNRTLNHN